MNNHLSNQPSNQELRHNLRQEVRTLRQRLSKSEQKLAEQKLLASLIQLPEVSAANKIAIYLTNDGELNTTAFIHWCWQQAIEVYLPIIHPFTAGNLLFTQYSPDTTLIKNKFGILEPQLDVTAVTPLSKLDVIFTPLVAFDQTGARLGMGGGFYDRTLAQWARGNLPQLTPIGLAHDCQQVEYVPTEVWDIAIPKIVTPSNCFTF